MRVAVVIDDLLTRAGVVDILHGAPEIIVVGTASTLDEGRALLGIEQPDVLITSVHLPPLREAAAPMLLQEARATGARTLVIADDDDPTLLTALIGGDASGWGWLVRSQLSDPGRLLTAVERVHRHGTVIDDAIVERLANRSRARSTLRPR